MKVPNSGDEQDYLSGNFSRVVLKNSAWVAASTYFNQLFTIFTGAILARILSPQDFGIVGMLMVFSGFVAVFSSGALGSAVIQFRDFTSMQLSTIFWLSAVLGVVTSLLFVAISPLIATFYKRPELSLLGMISGINFFLVSLQTVPDGLLRKKMQFKKLALISSFSAIISGLTGVYLAINGYGYWSLVLQTLTFTLVASLTTNIVAGWAPHFSIDSKVMREVFGFSGNLVLFNAVNYWARNGDNLIIGRFLGAAPLGFYNRAYSLMLYPINLLAGVVNPVLHPVLSSIQSDQPKVYAGYLKIIKLISLVSIPAMVFFAMLAKEIIGLVWGPQWRESVGVFQILSIVGGFQVITSTTGVVYLAKKRTDLLLKIGIINSVLLLTGISLGVIWGIEGVAWGYAIAFSIIFVPTMRYVMCVVLNGKISDLFVALRSSLLVGLAVFTALAIWNVLFRTIWSSVWYVLGAIVVALFVYTIALLRLDRIYVYELSLLLPANIQKRLSRVLKPLGGR